jgi:hypothetical protein
MRELSTADDRRFEAHDLLAMLEETGFVLFLEGGRALRWRFPRGKVSLALVAKLTKLEPELVDLLRARAERSRSGERP